MKIKYNCYQVAPEYRESPFYMDEYGWENITIDGNKDFKGRQTPEYEKLCDHFYDAAEDWLNRDYYPVTLQEVLKDWGFEKPDGKKWTTKEKHLWRVLFETDQYLERDENVCAALALLTGKKHNCTIIRGCCQGDWNYIYYPVDEYDLKSIEYLEAEYFNTGDEWRVVALFDDGTEDEDEVFYTYTHEWRDQAVELADAIGCEPDEIELYEWDGWARSPIYKKVV